MKSVVRVTAAVAVLVLIATPGEASHKRKRVTFFESLFGDYDGRQYRAERKRKAAERRRAWWLGGNEDFEQQSNRRAYVDPEPMPGFGMGNLAFVLPRLAAVSDKGFSSLIPTSAEGESIRIVLTDKATPIKADQTVREAVLAHYKQTNLRPVWIENNGLSERAKSVLAILKSSSEDGLEPSRYLPAGLSSFDDVEKQIAGSSIAAAQFDVGLTVAAATYVRHISGGAFDPAKLSLYFDVKPEYVDPAVAIRVLAFTPFPEQYLKALAPQIAAYQLLKDELRTLDESAKVLPDPFPTGKRVKVGQKDPRVVELRARMQALGHLSAEGADVEPDKENLLDKTLSKSLRAFQAASGIPETGALDQATVKVFNANNPENQREKILSSLERLRWLPKNLGERHVFVNQAAFEVKVKDKSKTVWTSKVIVGRPTTQTALFNDEMETVVFNPTWGMPQSILINEYLGKLRRDPGYFDRIGYTVVNAKGKKVSSRAVDWNSVGPKSGIGVTQPAGDGNALGELKFLFPNSHSIYMHDTPNRELFGEQRRAFSHGCVRVENPREFARVLLGMSDADIDARISAGATQSVKLANKVPVYLTYFTAWPDDSGKVRYYSDIYERDKTLERARTVVAKTFARDATVKIVQTAAQPGSSTSD